jgi:PadR family transcriptional regulator, regulatory protein PadR
MPCGSPAGSGSLLSKRKGTNQMSETNMNLPQGTLDLLILKAVALAPQHGWQISQRLHQMSSETLHVRQGSLYPALHRLERRGWIKASWGTTENNRRAKYYDLTRKGKAQLEAETDAWRRLTTAVGLVLETS